MIYEMWSISDTSMGFMDFSSLPLLWPFLGLMGCNWLWIGHIIGAIKSSLRNQENGCLQGPKHGRCRSSGWRQMLGVEEFRGAGGGEQDGTFTSVKKKKKKKKVEALFFLHLSLEEQQTFQSGHSITVVDWQTTECYKRFAGQGI